MLDGDPRRIRMVYSLLFSLPGHPDALLRRGDRDGRGPRGRGPDGGAYADAVVSGPNGGFSTAPPRRLIQRPGAGRLRPRAGQRERPEARPRLAVDLHPHADPDLPRLPRAGLGRVPGAPAAAPGGPGAPLHLAGLVDRGTAQPVAPAGHDAARAGDRGSRSGSTTCSRTSPSRPALAAPWSWRSKATGTAGCECGTRSGPDGDALSAARQRRRRAWSGVGPESRVFALGQVIGLPPEGWLRFCDGRQGSDG